MKKLIYLLLLLTCISLYAQKEENQYEKDTEFQKLMNYVPLGLKESIGKPNNQIFNFEFNTLGTISIFYEFKERFKLSNKENEWLKVRTKDFAIALFNEKKVVLLDLKNGLVSSDNVIKKSINGYPTSILKLIYSCTENTTNKREFITVFNNNMYQLMHVKPPSIKSELMKGLYKSKNANHRIELLLTEYGKFKFWNNKGHYSLFTEGDWIINGNKILLNSEKIAEKQDVIVSLSSSKWIEFKNMKLKLNKRYKIKGNKWKLKKTKNNL